MQPATNSPEADNLPPAHWVAHDIVSPQPPLVHGWQRDARAVAGLIFADRDGPPDAERLTWTAWRITAWLDGVEGRARFVFRFALFVVTFVAPLLVLRIGRLRSLDHEKGLLALERFEAGPFGMLLFALQALLSIVYFEHPDAAAAIGFDGRCMNGEPVNAAEVGG